MPEVIFDLRLDTGGTGIVATAWYRYVIHCTLAKQGCAVIWNGMTGALTSDFNAGGMDLDKAAIEQGVNQEGASTVTVRTQFFAVYDWGWYLTPPVGDGYLFFCGGSAGESLPDTYRVESLNIFTSTLSTYTWNGESFGLTDTSVLQSAMRIDEQASLEATNRDGQVATVTATFNEAMSNQNDRCRLAVDGVEVGALFGCKGSFTTLSWQDIVGDDREELVILTLSGVYDDELGRLTDKNCVHQRLLAYQWRNDRLQEIAHVTGCVVQPDLYGVSLEDIDGDGQVEIRAADSWTTGSECPSASGGTFGGYLQNCWYELGHRDEVYEWTGSRFINPAPPRVNHAAPPYRTDLSRLEADGG